MAFISGSVGVLSEAVHSLLDLISAGLSFFTVRHSVKPADEDHPFGHGKFETLSSLFETVLLLVAAGLIINEGIETFRHPRELQHAYWAIGVIFVSLVASWLAYRHNLKAAKETDSSALHVNALHFLSDVVASVGVLVGLVLIKVTGWTMLDPLMAFAVAIYIAAISVKQLKSTIQELSDSPLPECEVLQIREIIEGYQGTMIEVHDLRTRKSGAFRHIDFHLVVCGHMSVDESHGVCDEMESRILKLYPSANVHIHVEPCVADRGGCHDKNCQVQWGMMEPPRERGDNA